MIFLEKNKKIFVYLFLFMISIFLSSCASFHDIDVLPYEQKNGYTYTADRNVKTATDGFIVSGGMNNVRLSDANGGI